MNTARAAANEFIRLANEHGRPLTPMAIMKLVYIAHGWSLALRQRALIGDEVEAWQYGPVVPDLYQAMKRYGSGAVTQPLHSSIFFGSPDYPAQDDLPLIAKIYELYGALNGVQLSALTHQPNTPWSMTYDHHSRGNVISEDLITEHYQRLARERQAA